MGDTRASPEGQNQAWELEFELATGAGLEAGAEEAEGWDLRPESGRDVEIGLGLGAEALLQAWSWGQRWDPLLSVMWQARQAVSLTPRGPGCRPPESRLRAYGIRCPPSAAPLGPRQSAPPPTWTS